MKGPAAVQLLEREDGTVRRRLQIVAPLRAIGRPKPRIGQVRLGPRCVVCGQYKTRAIAYEAKAAGDWQRELQAFVLPHLRAFGQSIPLGRPVELRLRVVLPRPKKLVWVTQPMPELWAPVKPDGDNVQGLVQDALQKLLVRDQQIVRWVGEKVYAAGPGYGDTRPRIELLVEEL